MSDLETAVDEAFAALERDDAEAFESAAAVVMGAMGWTKSQAVEFFSRIRIEFA